MQTKQSNDGVQTSQSASKSNAIWITDAITDLAELFDVQLTQTRLRMYVDNLDDLDPEHLRAAITRAIRELRYFPRVAELRDFARQRQAQRTAWEEKKAQLGIGD